MAELLIRHGSRENVDALWENAYAVSSSALNSWFGEELRPIGFDVSWVRAGATGYFDRKTQREVKSYQRGRGLPPTGVVSVETWDALQQGRR